MKTKIYLFNNTHPANFGWNHCVAIAESGEFLADHVCSSIGYMRGDLYYDRPERKEKWATMYPDGIEIIELAQGEFPPEEVLKKNQELGKEADKSDGKAGVTLTVEDDDGKEHEIKYP